MNEREYLRLKQRFSDEYQEKIRALDLIWLEISGGKKPPKEAPETASTPHERGNAAAAVEEFVRQWNGDPFSAKQVEAWITQVKGQTANRTTIIHKLRRMVNDGDISLISQGTGKRASQYEVKRSEPAVPDEPAPAVEMASDTDVQELREFLEARNTDLNKYRENLLRNYGVDKARDLTKEQIRELIKWYKPEPAPQPEPEPDYSTAIMDMPDYEIPF